MQRLSERTYSHNLITVIDDNLITVIDEFLFVEVISLLSVIDEFLFVEALFFFYQKDCGRDPHSEQLFN